MKTDVTSRLILLRMQNISKKLCREDRNTCFIFNSEFLRISFDLWDDVEKYGRAGQVTDDNIIWLWCIFSRPSLSMLREEHQLDTTEWFIALIICSTCFGHLYAHHQELETTLVLLPHMVCNALVADGRRSGAGQQAVCPGWGKLLEQFPSSRTLHTICGNNTSVVSSSQWWAYKCPKHVEQIISTINHSVASSFFSSLRI